MAVVLEGRAVTFVKTLDAFVATNSEAVRLLAVIAPVTPRVPPTVSLPDTPKDPLITPPESGKNAPSV